MRNSWGFSTGLWESFGVFFPFVQATGYLLFFFLFSSVSTMGGRMEGEGREEGEGGWRSLPGSEGTVTWRWMHIAGLLCARGNNGKSFMCWLVSVGIFPWWCLVVMCIAGVDIGCSGLVRRGDWLLTRVECILCWYVPCRRPPVRVKKKREGCQKKRGEDLVSKFRGPMTNNLWMFEPKQSIWHN